MKSEELKSLIEYRLERANESFKAARLLFENNLYIPSMNRIYYSMFYAIQELLALKEKSFSKHTQVKSYFNREFIKTGIFPKELGKLFNIVFEYRQKFDYVDMIIPDRNLISDYLNESKNFIEEISVYVKKEITRE